MKNDLEMLRENKGMINGMGKSQGKINGMVNTHIPILKEKKRTATRKKIAVLGILAIMVLVSVLSFVSVQENEKDVPIAVNPRLRGTAGLKVAIWTEKYYNSAAENWGGASPTLIPAITEMLYWAGAEYEGLDRYDFQGTDTVKRFRHTSLGTGWWGDGWDVLIIPGGYAYGYDLALSAVGEGNMEQFIEAGGGVLGLCAGGYLIADSLNWEGSTYSYFQWIDGRAVGPINDIAPWPGYGLATCQIDDSLFGTVGNTFNVMYFGGGYFDTLGSTVTTIASYNYAGTANGEAAIIRGRFDTGGYSSTNGGFVIATGPHPESEESGILAPGDEGGTNLDQDADTLYWNNRNYMSSAASKGGTPTALVDPETDWYFMADMIDWLADGTIDNVRGEGKSFDHQQVGLGAYYQKTRVAQAYDRAAEAASRGPDTQGSPPGVGLSTISENDHGIFSVPSVAVLSGDSAWGGANPRFTISTWEWLWWKGYVPVAIEQEDINISSTSNNWGLVASDSGGFFSALVVPWGKTSAYAGYLSDSYTAPGDNYDEWAYNKIRDFIRNQSGGYLGMGGYGVPIACTNWDYAIGAYTTDLGLQLYDGTAYGPVTANGVTYATGNLGDRAISTINMLNDGVVSDGTDHDINLISSHWFANGGGDGTSRDGSAVTVFARYTASQERSGAAGSGEANGKAAGIRFSYYNGRVLLWGPVAVAEEFGSTYAGTPSYLGRDAAYWNDWQANSGGSGDAMSDSDSEWTLLGNSLDWVVGNQASSQFYPYDAIPEFSDAVVPISGMLMISLLVIYTRGAKGKEELIEDEKLIEE